MLFLHGVDFTHETAATPLFENVDLALAAGWTGVVGANGAGKTTLLRLAVAELSPRAGTIQVPGTAVYCPQRTDHQPTRLSELVSATDADARRTCGRLGVGADWPGRWETLSHGERKRAQIAVALWQAPDVLAIDEPTNHLDSEARDWLAQALHTYAGIGLLVSHDRELLDELCGQCLFLDPPSVVLRPGGYTDAARQAEGERRAAAREHRQAKSVRKKLEHEAHRRRAEASRADRKRSKRGIAPRDHDAKDKIDRARATGKDAVAGKLLRQIDGRLQQAREREAQKSIRREHELGIWLPGSRSQRNVLVRAPAGKLPLSAGRWLHYPALAILPTDRIALTGPNGAGKSTLVRHLIGRVNVPAEHVTYVPQEIDIAATQEIIARTRALPRDKLGHMMMIVSRLNSRPERLLESDLPSPGELRKMLLALEITQEPHLIVMDEPTNHMDLPSIECLERALADCPCAMLLVSHDRRFLEKLTDKEWRLARGDAQHRGYQLHEH
ncbi:MAG: ABC-F family ATP-binding cassette domain-containing protein [Candidatus Eisenbacteria sp.]|nr:ABC-F family ATP-binding cassette domain-containing protein [Candidatus Eisenbacteria bacterium]